MLFLGAASAHAQTALRPFSAELTHTVRSNLTVPAKATTGRIYATEHAFRTEMDGDGNGRQTITIVRLDRNEVCRLDPSGPGTIEWPYISDSMARYAEFVGYLAGAQVERTALGVDQIGPYRCNKSALRVTFKGHVYASTEWTAPELKDFVVKREGENGEWSSEYSNIQFGAQNAQLFEAPTEGKTIKYSQGWGPVTDHMMSTFDTAKSVAIARAAGLKVTGDDPNLRDAHSEPKNTYMVWISDPVTNVLIFSVHTDVDYFPRKQPPSDTPRRTP
jgi:hypothetical protein